MNHLILTNCTNRKSVKVPKLLPQKSHFEFENPDVFIKYWLEQISNTTDKAKAIDVYKGRSVSEIINAQSILNAEILFVSAGLGLIRANEYIPNYDLTISDGEYSLKPLLTRWNISESEWWEKLFKQSKSIGIFNYFNGKIFVALPNNYLKMILPLLKSFDENNISKLHLFIHPASYTSLPQELKKCYMPYNYSLDFSEFTGTKVDYCQRCLNHFVKFIYKPGQDISESTQLVKDFITSLPSIPAKIKRQSMTDEQIKNLILEGWVDCRGRSTKLLRFIRDEKQVACEQSRFQFLWNNVKTTKNLENSN